MNNKILWLSAFGLLFLLLIGSWILFGGCSASVSPDIQATTTTPTPLSSTSTQVGETTTTTLGPAGGVSGTVSWDWGSSPSQTGTLYVFLWTNDDFSNRDLLAFNGIGPAAQKVSLSSGQTSANFNFAAPDGPLKGTSPTPGQYYLMALLYIGRDAQIFDDPELGDKIGQFSDGLLPKGLGGNSNPTAIISSTSPMTNNNFSLNAIWTGAPTTTTTTTTIPAGLWQDIGGVTKGGSAGNAWVNKLTFDNSGNLYVGGMFDSAGGVPANYIAKWNSVTSSWESLAGGVDGPVEGILFDSASGNLYVGGVFTNATNNPGGPVIVNKIAKWNIASGTWSALGSGFVGSGDQIIAMALASSGNVYAAGNFSNAGGVPANNVAEWKIGSSAWDGMAGGVGASFFCQVWDMAYTNGNLFVGGSFTTAESLTVNGFAKWNGSSWGTLGAGPASGAYVLDAYDSSHIYAGGGVAGGIDVIQKWNGSTWESFMPPDANPPLQALGVRSPSEVYVGRYGYGKIAKWNGSSWSNLAGDLVHSSDTIWVRDFAFDPSGNLYIGGKFTSAGGTPAANIVKRINP